MCLVSITKQVQAGDLQICYVSLQYSLYVFVFVGESMTLYPINPLYKKTSMFNCDINVQL